MVEVRTVINGHSSNLYYRTNDDSIHIVADQNDKKYMGLRSVTPKKVIFVDTISEAHITAQRLMREGESMSTTVSLICEDCRADLLIGQRGYIWLGEADEMQALQKFLFAHMNHTLRFVNEHYDGLDEYSSVNF